MVHQIIQNKQDTDCHRGIWAQKNGMGCECKDRLYPFLLLEIFFPMAHGIRTQAYMSENC